MQSVYPKPKSQSVQRHSHRCLAEPTLWLSVCHSLPSVCDLLKLRNNQKSISQPKPWFPWEQCQYAADSRLSCETCNRFFSQLFLPIYRLALTYILDAFLGVSGRAKRCPHSLSSSRPDPSQIVATIERSGVHWLQSALQSLDRAGVTDWVVRRRSIGGSPASSAQYMTEA